MKLKKDCVSCSHNLMGVFPCTMAGKPEVIEWLEKDTDECCPLWYDEY
jgi:hypothetical protein